MMPRWLSIPRLSPAELRVIGLLVALGAFVAGLYGMAHDIVTYSISPEYFTRFKFHQFAWADSGGSRWFFAMKIGFLATWWVGGLSAWFIARAVAPGRSFPDASRMAAPAFLIVLGAALFAALGIGLYDLWQPHEVDSWRDYIRLMRISDPVAFVRVARIHNAGYVGAIAGTFGAVFWSLRRARRQ